MNRLFTAILILASSSFLVSQTPNKTTKPALPTAEKTTAPKPTAPKPTVTPTPPTAEKPQASQSTGPKGTVVTPADIEYGTSKIPGDSEVNAILGELININNQYNQEIKAVQDKYNPQWTQDQARMQIAIQKVKDANKWGDDVVFYTTTKQWIRLDPSEVLKMKKAESQPEPKK